VPFLAPVGLPTPVLGLSMRRLRAHLGLMVAASYSPRVENRLKLYVAGGGQLLHPLDAEIAVELSPLPDSWEDGPCPKGDRRWYR
jgi:phosphomannomutase